MNLLFTLKLSISVLLKLFDIYGAYSVKDGLHIGGSKFRNIIGFVFLARERRSVCMRRVRQRNLVVRGMTRGSLETFRVACDGSINRDMVYIRAVVSCDCEQRQLRIAFFLVCKPRNNLKGTYVQLRQAVLICLTNLTGDMRPIFQVG